LPLSVHLPLRLALAIYLRNIRGTPFQQLRSRLILRRLVHMSFIHRSLQEPFYHLIINGRSPLHAMHQALIRMGRSGLIRTGNVPQCTTSPGLCGKTRPHNHGRTTRDPIRAAPSLCVAGWLSRFAEFYKDFEFLVMNKKG